MVAIAVTSLAGETLLEADIPEPVTGQQIIERLPGTTRFGRLLRDSESLDLSAELSVDGSQA